MGRINILSHKIAFFRFLSVQAKEKAHIKTKICDFLYAFLKENSEKSNKNH